MTAKFLSVTHTQGSADAFVTTALPTGVGGSPRAALRVRAIQISWPAVAEVDSIYQAEIMRRLPTAIVGTADRRSMWVQTRQVAITTSGSWTQDAVEWTFYPRDFDLLIVEDPIYFSSDSNGTSATNAFGARIWYEPVNLTETEKLAALNESANA